MKRFLTLTALTLFACVLHAQQTGYFNTTVQWVNSHGSQNRALRVFVPNNYSASNSYALVIGFHGFYSTADLHNTCNDPLHCQHKYSYANAWKLMVCITAGSPASCFINIETNHAGITRRAELMNMTGAVVYKTEFSDFGTSIPVHNMAEGLYLLKIYGMKGETIFQGRVVVIH